jgi:fatty acid desaturase
METKMKKNGMIWNDLIKNPLNLTNSIILLIGIMPAILGFSLNLIPLAVGYFFTKTKVKQKEFKASILMVVTMVLFLLQYIILTALAIFGILPWLLILVAVIRGLWLRYYYTIYENSKIINFKKLVEFKSEAINILNKI